MAHLDRVNQALTSTYWNFTYLHQDSCPARVIDSLCLELPHISVESWVARSEFGGIYVNGRKAALERELRAPCRLEYYEPKFPIERAQQHFPSLGACAVVHEDPDLVVLFKPAGLPCLPTKEQYHFHLKGYFEKHYNCALHFPSRLDTSTAGLVAVSRTSRMNKTLQQAFEKREIEKTYLLEVSEQVSWQTQTVSDAIGRDPSHSVLRRIDHKNGLSAHTDFSVVERRTANRTLLSAQPRSGRTHQIRVHSLSMGLPIVGDNFYGGARCESLHLLSWQVGLFHPYLDKHVHITLPQELSPPWALFSQ